MRISVCIVQIILFSVLLGSCDNRQKSIDIVGVWKCDIEYPNMDGVQFISCKEDSSVTIIDSLLYSLNEKDLNVSLRCNVSNSGRWNIQDGLLSFDLQKFIIEIDTTSLMISCDSRQMAVDTLRQDYGLFKKELFKQIETSIADNYPNVYVGQVEIGKIQISSQNELTVVNSGNTIVLRRCGNR